MVQDGKSAQSRQVTENSAEIQTQLSQVLQNYSLGGVIISEFTLRNESPQFEVSPLCQDITGVLRETGVMQGTVCSVTLTDPNEFIRQNGLDDTAAIGVLGWCFCPDSVDPIADFIRFSFKRCPCPKDPKYSDSETEFNQPSINPNEATFPTLDFDETRGQFDELSTDPNEATVQ